MSIQNELIFLFLYNILFLEGDRMDIFCKIINKDIPSNVVYEDDIVIVIMDVSPRSPGHVLIIPKVHYQDLFDIDSNVLNHIMDVSKKIGELLTKKLGCDGFTLENNIGIAQEVKHFHLHIIPKYSKKIIKDNIDDIFYKIMY